MNRMNRKRSPSLSAKSDICEKKKFSKNEVQDMIKQEVHSAVGQTENKLESLLQKVQQLECEITYGSAIHNLQAHINRVKRRGDAALAYVRKLGYKGIQDNRKKKSPLRSPVIVNVDLTRSCSEVEILPHTDQRMDDHSDVFQQTVETMKTALKNMHTDNEVLKRAIQDLSKGSHPPTPSHFGSAVARVSLAAPAAPAAPAPPAPPVSPQCERPERMMKNEAEQQVEEQQPDKMKVKHLSGGNNSSHDHTESEKEEISYPPLPPTPFPSSLSMEAASYNIPQRHTLQLALIKNPPGLSVLWNVEEEDPSGPPMESYSTFMATEKVKGSAVFAEWKPLGEVKAIPLPMCVMIKKYKPGYKACFTVVGKDQFGRYGPYSKIVSANIPE